MRYNLKFIGNPHGNKVARLVDIEVEASDPEKAAAKSLDTHENIVGGLSGIQVMQMGPDDEV